MFLKRKMLMLYFCNGKFFLKNPPEFCLNGFLLFWCFTRKSSDSLLSTSKKQVLILGGLGRKKKKKTKKPKPKEKFLPEGQCYLLHCVYRTHLDVYETLKSQSQVLAHQDCLGWGGGIKVHTVVSKIPGVCTHRENNLHPCLDYMHVTFFLYSLSCAWTPVQTYNVKHVPQWKLKLGKQKLTQMNSFSPCPNRLLGTATEMGYILRPMHWV